MNRPPIVTPAFIVSIMQELDSHSVTRVDRLSSAELIDGTSLVYVDIVTEDWLRVADSFDLDAGQLPAGGADLIADIIFLTLHMDGYRLRSSVPLSLIGDVEDVLHIMGVKKLEAWKLLAGVAA